VIRKLRLITSVALLFLLQATVVHRFSYRFLRPDLLLLAVAYLALEADFPGALWGSLAIGLLRDLASGGPLGATPLVLVPACAGLVLLREHLLRESFWTDLALAVLFLAAFSAGEGALTLLFVPGSAARQVAAQAAGQTAFTAALAPLVIPALGAAGVVDRSLSADRA